MKVKIISYRMESHLCDMDLICRIYKELKFNKKIIHLKMGQKILTRYFYKEDTQMPISPLKDAQDHKLLGSTNSNHNKLLFHTTKNVIIKNRESKCW